MQTFQIEVEDNIADKVLWFLENLKENITIKRLDKLVIKSDFEKSIQDLKQNNIVPIGNIDTYIKELEDEIS